MGTDNIRTPETLPLIGRFKTRCLILTNRKAASNLTLLGNFGLRISNFEFRPRKTCGLTWSTTFATRNWQFEIRNPKF